jgi:hypothetical protein
VLADSKIHILGSYQVEIFGKSFIFSFNLVFLKKEPYFFVTGTFRISRLQEEPFAI